MTPDLDRRTFLAQVSAASAAAAAAAAGLGALGCRNDAGTSMSGGGSLDGLSATAAIAAMKSGEIKAEAYATALLDRAQRLERLNAFRAFDREKVLIAAREADKARSSGTKLGKLHGLPIPVKDSINTTMYGATNGTKWLTAFRPSEDAGVLKPLFAAGAILMGKTNLHELSMGFTSFSATFGQVHNPYDTTAVPGGSSGGSAVAVAAHMAPLAVAEDTLGSIRIPATMCGIAGLRPSFGRYPRDGIMPLTDDKFDTPGPLARSVDDLVLFDSVITGDDSPLAEIPIAGARIGVPDFFMSGLDPEVERIVRDVLAKLGAAGATLVPVKLPESVRGAESVAVAIFGYEVVASLTNYLNAQKTGITFDQMIDQAALDVQGVIKAFGRAPGRPSKTVYDAMLTQRQKIRDDIKATFAKENIAALAFPPAMIPPPKIADVGQMVRILNHDVPRVDTMARNISLGSVASLASLVLPAGLTKDGLPVGIEFDALNGDDRKLLALGKSIEKALGPVAAPRIAVM